MPSTAVIAGGVVGILVLAGVGVGLGVGLSGNDGDSSPTSPADAAQSQTESGTRSVGAETVGGVSTPAEAPISAPSPSDPAMAFAPTPSRAFGPAFAPTPSAPETVAPVFAGFAPTPVAPEPVAPEPVAPEPVAPEPVAPEPVAPEPVAPEPVAPEPVAPEPEAPVPAPEPEEAPVPAPMPEEEVEPVPAPAPELVADISGVAPGPDGKYAVCPGSWEKRDWKTEPCGVTIGQDGSVKLGEYFGGFDGYFSVDPADGHENCFNWSVSKMFQQEFCETEETDKGLSCTAPASGSCVCFGFDKKNVPIQTGSWPGNQGIIKFLTKLRDVAGPIDYDHPQDVEIADNGGRTDNQKLVEATFEKMITIAGNC